MDKPDAEDKIYQVSHKTESEFVHNVAKLTTNPSHIRQRRFGGDAGAHPEHSLKLSPPFPLQESPSDAVTLSGWEEGTDNDRV